MTWFFFLAIWTTLLMEHIISYSMLYNIVGKCVGRYDFFSVAFFFLCKKYTSSYRSNVLYKHAIGACFERYIKKEVCNFFDSAELSQGFLFQARTEKQKQKNIPWSRTSLAPQNNMWTHFCIPARRKKSHSALIIHFPHTRIYPLSDSKWVEWCPLKMEWFFK